MIRIFDDPILSVQCAEVRQDEDLSFIQTLKQVLRATENGVGLASPQIGKARAAVAIRFDLDKENDIFVMINPQIIGHSTEMELGAEGCLSYPGVDARISRFVSVAVKYFDESWQEKTESYSGFKARVVAHEIEHCLDGTCKVGLWWKETVGQQITS